MISWQQHIREIDGGAAFFDPIKTIPEAQKKISKSATRYYVILLRSLGNTIQSDHATYDEAVTAAEAEINRLQTQLIRGLADLDNNIWNDKPLPIEQCTMEYKQEAKANLTSQLSRQFAIMKHTETIEENVMITIKT